MSRKIILFLSSYQETKAKEVVFSCPNGLEVSGKQTNEAPVKYLLHTYPDISEILCVVTPDAEQTALPYFQQVIKTISSEIPVTSIAFQEEDDFNKTALLEVVQKINAHDEILLETTGGFRNAAMYLVLVSRVLSYNGSQTIAAVYANLQKKRIEDVFEILNMFDLIGGMQELSSFGNVRSLRKYYGRPAQDEKIEALLHAIEDLTETITLCRTRLIEEKMNQFNQSLNGIKDCQDLVMRQLFPAFRQKIGQKMTIPILIKWCVESDMLQQALTIYRERIPLYIMKTRNNIIGIKKGIRAPWGWEKKYECPEEAHFFENLLKLGKRFSDKYKSAIAVGEDVDYIVYTLKGLEKYLSQPQSYFILRCEFPAFEVILMDFLYIRALRNMINHANEKHTALQERLMQYLMERGYRNLDDMTAEDIRQMILTSIEHLKV